MKVNRINVLIKHADNKHKPLLNNEMKDLMSQYKFGGLFTPDRVELHNAPESIMKLLIKLKIGFKLEANND